MVRVVVEQTGLPIIIMNVHMNVILITKKNYVVVVAIVREYVNLMFNFLCFFYSYFIYNPLTRSFFYYF
jgi:hypothetical protein